jgi:hypothetical protein
VRAALALLRRSVSSAPMKAIEGYYFLKPEGLHQDFPPR